MAALTLGNLITRVQRIVPTAGMSAAIQEAILERLQYLVSLEQFPFQQEISGAPDMTASQIYVSVPSTIQVVTSLYIDTDDYEGRLTYLDNDKFNEVFPDSANRSTNTPVYWTYKDAEGKVYFDCPPDIAYGLQWEGFAIPLDATLSASISPLTELAKLTLVQWGAADVFRGSLSEHDRADRIEAKGDKFFMALKRRYQLAIEANSRFISQKEIHLLKKRAS